MVKSAGSTSEGVPKISPNQSQAPAIAICSITHQNWVGARDCVLCDEIGDGGRRRSRHFTLNALA